MVACFVNRGRAFFAQSFLAGQEGLLRIRKTPKPDWKNQKYLRQEAALLTTGASNAFSRRCTLISDFAPPLRTLDSWFDQKRPSGEHCSCAFAKARGSPGFHKKIPPDSRYPDAGHTECIRLLPVLAQSAIRAPLLLIQFCLYSLQFSL
jgi:hypothetical protein